MTLESVINWIPTEAGAGWLVAGLGALWYFIQSFRKRPIVFSEIATSSLVDVDISLRERIKVTFDDQPISSLSAVRAEIYNTSKAVISDASLTFTPGPNARLLSVVAQSSDGECKILSDTSTDKAKLTIEYLNPWKPDKHSIALSFTIEGEPVGWKVIGGGKGVSISTRSLRPTTLMGIPIRWQTFLTAFIGTVVITALASITYSATPIENSLIKIIPMGIAAVVLGIALGFIEARKSSPNSSLELLNAVKHVPKDPRKGQFRDSVTPEELALNRERRWLQFVFNSDIQALEASIKEQRANDEDITTTPPAAPAGNAAKTKSSP